MTAVIVGYIVSPYFGRPTGANFFGKIKLNLQVISVGFFIVGIFLSNHVLINIAKYVLIVALFFAVMAGVEAARRRVRAFLAERNIKIVSAKE
jgi:phosphatidylglycerophosphate synthase